MANEKTIDWLQYRVLESKIRGVFRTITTEFDDLDSKIYSLSDDTMTDWYAHDYHDGENHRNGEEVHVVFCAEMSIGSDAYLSLQILQDGDLWIRSSLLALPEKRTSRIGDEELESILTRLKSLPDNAFELMEDTCFAGLDCQNVLLDAVRNLILIWVDDNAEYRERLADILQTCLAELAGFESDHLDSAAEEALNKELGLG